MKKINTDITFKKVKQHQTELEKLIKEVGISLIFTGQSNEIFLGVSLTIELDF